MHVQGLERLPALRTPAVHDLNRALGRLRLRLGLERLALFSVRGLFASSLALAVLAVGAWLFEADVSVFWLAAAPWLAAAAFALVRWPSRRETALAADRRLGLEERLATALELVERDHRGRFAPLQVRNATERVAATRGTWLLLDRGARNETLLAAAALSLAIVIALVMPGVPHASPTTVADDTPVLAVDTPSADADQLDERTLPLDTPDDQAIAAPAPAQAASQSQADLAARVQQEQAERSALDQLSQALDDVSAGQPAANAIQQGDFGGARDQLQNLADNADQLSDAAKQQLARSLQNAAAATAQTDRALAEREQQAAQALARSTYGDQRQALRALGDQVERSGSRSVSSDQLERDMGQLQQPNGAGQLRAGTTSTQAAAAQSPSNGQAGATPSSSTGAQGDVQTAGGQGAEGAGEQPGAGAGNGTDPNLTSNQPSRLDSQGQQVQVPTRLSQGAGVRPPTGNADQSAPDPRLGGRTVSELAQSQQTGQVTPEQNLVPGEQRPVVRGYFR